jgi:hypothetical protein
MVVAFRQPERPGAAVPVERGVKPAATPVGPQTYVAQQLEETIWPARLFAVLCHLVIVLGLVVMGRVHFQDTMAGMGAATFYLLLPYTGLYVGQTAHVWPAALVVWAIVLYRSPLGAGILLGLAAGTMYFPALIVPLWLSFYWRRGAARFLGAVVLTAALALAVTALHLWWNDKLDAAFREAWTQAAWQVWRVPTTEGVWTGVHGAYRIPICLAYVAFVLLTAFWPMPKNLAHVIALSAAVFIGIQFWYADQGGVYVLWYLPLLLLLAFRPNLEERRPPVISGRSWLARLVIRLRRLVARRKIQPAEPAKL